MSFRDCQRKLSIPDWNADDGASSAELFSALVVAGSAAIGLTWLIITELSNAGAAWLLQPAGVPDWLVGLLRAIF